MYTAFTEHLVSLRNDQRLRRRGTLNRHYVHLIMLQGSIAPIPPHPTKIKHTSPKQWGCLFTKKKKQAQAARQAYSTRLVARWTSFALLGGTKLQKKAPTMKKAMVVNHPFIMHTNFNLFHYIWGKQSRFFWWRVSSPFELSNCGVRLLLTCSSLFSFFTYCTSWLS